MSGRDQVLAKVRSALRTAERAAGEEQRHDPPAPARRARPPVDRAELVERFAERVADYRATVVRCGPDEVTGAVADALADLDPRGGIGSASTEVDRAAGAGAGGGSETTGVGRGAGAGGEATEAVRGGGAEGGAIGLEPESDPVADAARVPGVVVAAPAGLPAAWRPRGALDGSTLATRELREVDAVVTACRVAIAETGTIVLDHAPDQGPRRLTLVPDRHVCVVGTSQILDDVDDAFLALRPGGTSRPGEATGPDGPDGARGSTAPTAVTTGAPPLTFISGPSATSDIELQRVEGVHGPRTLIVVLVDDERSEPPSA